MIAVVVGPPCAGKSTYVRAMARPGDVTVDYDALAVALGSDRRHEAPRSVAECAFAARSAAVSALIAGGYDGYVIHTRPSAGDMGRYRSESAPFPLTHGVPFRHDAVNGERGHRMGHPSPKYSAEFKQ